MRRRPPAVANGRRAFRRSTAAICDAATALLGLDRRLSPHVIRAAFAPPFIQTRPAIEGRPLIGVGQRPRLLGRGYVAPPAGAAIPAPPTRRLRKPPSVSQDGEEYSPRKYVRQGYVRMM